MSTILRALRRLGADNNVYAKSDHIVRARCLVVAAAERGVLGQDGLSAGARIEVKETTGRATKGAFVSLSPEALSLETGKGQVAIERSRIREVRVRSGSRRLRRTLIGAGIGLAVGIAADRTLGAYLNNESSYDQRPLMFLAPIALFAGFGAAFPAYRTVYRAP